MDSKKYNSIIIYPLLVVLAMIYGMAVVLQPLDGDLTRLGSYLESEYGWNQPQEGFAEDLYTHDKTGEYKEHYDIVVMGDSFSTLDKPYQWQNYLANATGLNVVTFNDSQFDLEEFVASEAFQKHPPKIFIWEFTERFIPGYAKVDSDPCAPEPTPQFQAADIRSLNRAVRPVERDARVGFLNPNFHESAFYLKNILKRYYDLYVAVHLNRLPRTIRLDLNADNLFSSKRSGEILLYRGDIEKIRRFQEPMIQNWHCKTVQMQNLIQKSGTTFFVAMPVPDKTTAYEDYIQFEKDQNVNLTEKISEQQGINMIRLDTVLKEKIKAGEKDVYLPNDTHWGYKGHRLASKTLIRYLEERGILKRN